MKDANAGTRTLGGGAMMDEAHCSRRGEAEQFGGTGANRGNHGCYERELNVLFWRASKQASEEPFANDSVSVPLSTVPTSKFQTTDKPLGFCPGSWELPELLQLLQQLGTGSLRSQSFRFELVRLGI